MFDPTSLPQGASQPEDQLAKIQEQSLEHTRLSLEYMAKYGIKPEGHVHLFLPPSTRQQEIHHLPYEHDTHQVIVYETEPGEFSALCPFSGLPDFGILRVEYMPKSWILELKSLKILHAVLAQCWCYPGRYYSLYLQGYPQAS